MWKKSGAERIKSFRLYRELESEYARALAEVERLQRELQRKDDLCRRLAAELAGAPTAGAPPFMPVEATLPMPFSEERRTMHPKSSVPMAPTVPVQGNGEETTETDELGHIKTTPKGTKAKGR